jgi:outer membrane protein assembly factor BamE (lipoprotein component of BamABCDE complex)
MNSKILGTILVTATLLVGGCAQYENKRGVLEQWRDASGQDFVSGQTTRQDVLAALGPPSQVIALGDETVLYYLFERTDGDGLILIVYNQFKTNTQYDRAIFFFDDDDKLTDYASEFPNAGTL